MYRRDVLSTIRPMAAGSLVALAGCSSGSDGSTTDGPDQATDDGASNEVTDTATPTPTPAYTGCPPDDAAPEEVVPPESESFGNRRPYDPFADEPDVSIDAGAAATMQYDGPDGAYYVAVYRFENRDATADGYETIRRHAGSVGPVVAFVMRTTHVIFGRGQSESPLRTLLGSSQYIGADCLRNFRVE